MDSTRCSMYSLYVDILEELTVDLHPLVSVYQLLARSEKNNSSLKFQVF